MITGEKMKYLAIVFVLIGCANGERNIYQPTKHSYVLIQSIDQSMQRFQYVLNPKYLVYEEGDTVEIWGDTDEPTIIRNVTCISFGPQNHRE